MFFNDIIKRRLATLLQPWLRDDQDLEVKLGFLRSKGILSNISFNTSALNELLDDPSKCCFKQATVEHLSLQFSPFSSAAFTLIVRGLHVVLSLGEEEDEGGVKWRRKPRDTTVEERNKFLAEIDPEGCALHGAIKKISDITIGTWRTSLLDTIIRHCHLQLHGFQVLLQSPCLGDQFSCSLYMKKFEAGPQNIGHRWFIRGFMSSFFVPCEESSFVVDMDNFEIRLNRNNGTNCVFPATDMFGFVKWNHLQSTSFCFNVPALNFVLTPADLSVIFLFYGLLSKDYKRARHGRQLWNIVATNVSSLLPTSKLSMIKVVRIGCQWLSYINTYQNVLLLVGYPVAETMKRSATLMSSDTAYSTNVRYQLKLIAEIENDLPLEAVAVARRIIRHRVASNVPCQNSNFDELLPSRPFRKLHQLLVLFFSMIGSFFVAFIRVFFYKVLAVSPQCSLSSGSACEDIVLQQKFTLKVQEISLSVSSDNADQPNIRGKPVSDTEISYQDILSFQFSVDGLFCTYMVNISEQCFRFASGRLKVHSFRDTKADLSSYSERRKKEVDKRHIVAWSEPAQVIYFPESISDSGTDGVTRTSVPHLDCLLGKLWLNWKDYCLKSEGRDIPDVQAPWILCEISSCLTDHVISDSSSPYNCSFIVGKLNCNLGYCSIASTVVFLRQIQNALCWSARRKNNVVLPPAAITIQDPLVKYWSNFSSYSSKIETDIIRVLPQKPVQIAAFIAGPYVVISLLNDKLQARTTDPHHLGTQISLEFCNIELLVSPNLEDNVGLSSENTSECYRGCFGLKEPEEIDIPKSDNGAYSCQGQTSLNAYLKVNGLKACFEDTTENKKSQIVLLRPITMQLSFVRKEHHSFGSSVIAVSTVSRMVATGFTCLTFMDELFVLTKILFGSVYESLAFSMDDSGGDLSYEEVSSAEAVHFESETGQAFSVGSKQASLDTNHQVFISSTFELKSFDMIFHNSRSNSPETYTGMVPVDRDTSRNSAIHGASSNGFYISIQQSLIEFLYKGQNLDVVLDMTGVRCIIFKYLAEFARTSDKSELKSLLCSLNFLTEASLYRSKLRVCLRNLEKILPSSSLHGTADVSNRHRTAPCMSDDALVNTERLEDHWLFTNLLISGIYIGRCKVKDILVNEVEELTASLSVGGKLQAISFKCKGGWLLLEITAAVMFIECCNSYCQWITELWPFGQLSGRVVAPKYSSAIAPLDGHLCVNHQQLQHQKVLWDHVETFAVSLLHLSLVLVERDESGRLQELLFEVDFHFSLELLNTVRKISISGSKFSLLSQFMHEDLVHSIKVNESCFSSIVPDDSLPSFISKDSSPFRQDNDSIQSYVADASDTSTSVSQRGSQGDISMGNPGQKSLYRSPQRYILESLQCVLSAEGPVTRDQICPAYSNNIWLGSGSISGFDMTVSLCEVKMVISAFESFSKVLSTERNTKVESRNWSYNEEQDGSREEMIPDGTIVAIQDVDQHMYVAVDGTGSKYDITGSIHYSLVGERALFRVKYDKPRIWKPQVHYFSLISLYAKDNSGVPLRLNCRPRSRFVDINCSIDSSSALWRMIPFKPDAYEDAMELECSTLSKRTFHLVNKKNDYAVAFTDGILEFVSKPGNLFKWKVFDVPGNNLPLNRPIVEGHSSPTDESREVCASPGTSNNFRSDRTVTDTGELRANENHFGITVTVEKVTLTIVHELSDTEEKFPLIQGSILPNQTIIQISKSKARVINTFEFTLCYFDAQKNSWKEFIQPLQILTFYSQKFLIQGVDSSSHGVPNHFYAKIKEVTVLLSELSLDILLFVIGKLDLAGPYTVKSSMILANCCKVENQSGMTLACQFYDNQEASVSARQSTTILLRHLNLANQPPEASFFSLQLLQQGSLSTSPIYLSLLEAQQFAWRTRIVSSQDNKSFPGPFIVVGISKGIEDGLSISVSPILRIHNETDFSLELRFQRPQHEETESVSVILKDGEVVDDVMTAFSAVDMSGGLRKALTSLSVGNYVFSFRPNTTSGPESLKRSSVEWSDNLRGGKPVRLSGLFDKLSYQVRKAFSVDPIKFSLISANCALRSEEGLLSNMYFLIQTVGKAIPILNPDNSGYAPVDRNSPVAMQEQKEIFILPTIQVLNLLHTDIHVSLTDKDPNSIIDSDTTLNQATISSGSTANFYADPGSIYFVVTLTSIGSSCKPVNSSDWLRKLQKKKGDISHLDIELDFGGGKYFAMLRLSRGHRGTLEAGIFTSYALQNDTNVPLFCFPANQKPLPRVDMERFGIGIPPELGLYLSPKSISSWFLKCEKLRFKLLEEKELEAQLDLDVLSGLTEIDLETEEIFGSKDIMKLGVSLRPSFTKKVSSQMVVSLRPRYVVCNESEDAIVIRQCHIEDMEECITVNSKQSIALRQKAVVRNKKETSLAENLLRKHTKTQTDSSFFIQFRPNETGLGWSGPVCVASLGRFFLKFKKSSEFQGSQSNGMSYNDNLGEFATVHVVEEGSTIVLHFHRPPVTDLPYRIENCLHDTPLTYYQKGSSEPETLGAGVSAKYVWDDMTLPHKLIVQLDDVHLLREINLDKVRSWKPIYRNKQNRGLGLHIPLNRKPEDQKRATSSRVIGSETMKAGFEVYAEGVTRVLRICESSNSHKENMVSGSSRKMRLRVSYFSVHLLEHAKQEDDLGEPSNYAPIIITRLERINWDAIFTVQTKYNQIRVQSLSVDEKWVGAPFGAMLRRHRSEKSDVNDILHVAVVLLPSTSSVRQVKYLSIVLQPLDLNLDEETLMKIVPFWRRSLSESSSPRQQYYFDHFEIHPIKIVASFLPGDAHYKYDSTQETLRSLLHSVIKIPAIQKKTVELNGVLVTHALITLQELTIKCAQHYSWYAMRAIYIAKGSPLLPPAFASIFDDLASSSLDVFFDPSTGLVNVPGVTLGTLKLISKFIDNKGFSGTKRYFGDLGKTLKTAGSNILFAAVTEVSDSILKGAETTGFKGMVNGFHQGILKLAMEPSVLSSAFMEGGPDRKIVLDRSPGVDELYIEGYLQAMLDTMYKQEYLRVRVFENQVILKNLPPSSSLIDEIMENVKGFLASKALLKGEPSTAYSLRHMRGEREWRIGPTVLTLCEHLFVSFMIRVLRKQSGKVTSRIKWKWKADEEEKAIVPPGQKMKVIWKWGIGRFVFSGLVAYIDGRLCRNIPNPLARRIVSGFLLSFLDQSDHDDDDAK